MKSINVQLTPKKFSAFFKRYHLTFFIIFIAAVLATVVLLINNAVVNPSVGSDSVAPDPNSAAMQRLHSSDELRSAPVLPNTRNNPFQGE